MQRTNEGPVAQASQPAVSPTFRLCGAPKRCYGATAAESAACAEVRRCGGFGNPRYGRLGGLRYAIWRGRYEKSALALMLAAVAHLACRGEICTNHPFLGITCISETRQDPPTRLFIAEVELTNSNVRVRVAPGGPDPDGPGKWQTTLMAPSQVAAREGFDLVVNGDFFDARGVRDAEGTNSGYHSEAWAAVLGPAVTDGVVWSTCASNRPCLVVHKGRKVTFEILDRPTPDDWEVVAGNTMLIQDSLPVPHTNKTRHPRTVVGLDANATRLILLVVDGRKPGVAVGMNYDELAAEMLQLGCRQALNLDGGGSSVMAIRDPVSGKFRVLNEPSDGHERPVANVLGISTGSTDHAGAGPNHQTGE